MRADAQRLDDMLAAAAPTESHPERGTLADGLLFDAVRVRPIEIGEAVKDIDPDHLAHRDVDTDHEIVTATVEHDLPPSIAAVKRLKSAEEV